MRAGKLPNGDIIYTVTAEEQASKGVSVIEVEGDGDFCISTQGFLKNIITERVKESFDKELREDVKFRTRCFVIASRVKGVEDIFKFADKVREYLLKIEKS